MSKLKNDNVPVFLINLDRSYERLARMNCQFEALKIDYERVAAIDGKKLKTFRPHFNAKRFKLECDHELQPGEVGCSLSHIAIWKRIVKHKLFGAIVVEDDVELNSNFPKLIKIADKLNCDYIKLDIGENEIDERGRVFDEDIRLIACHHVDQFEVRETNLAPLTTGCYFISFNGANQFLKFSKNMYYPIDLLPRYVFPYTRQGYISPPSVVLDNSQSTIDGRNFITEKRVDKYIYKLFSSKRFRDMAVYMRTMKKSCEFRVLK